MAQARDGLRHAAWLRLTLILGLGATAIWLAAASWLSYRQIHVEAGQKLDQLTRLVAEHALMSFETNEVMAGRVRDVLLDDGSPQETVNRERERRIHHRLREIAQTIPQAQSIWVWNSDGAALASSSVYPVPAQLNAATRDYFEFQKRPGAGLFVSEPMRKRANSGALVHLSWRREASDGRFMGVIVITLDMRAFNDYYRDLARDTSLSLVLARADGMMISRYPEAPDSSVRLRFDQQLADTPDNKKPAERAAPLTVVRRVGALPLYASASLQEESARERWLQALVGLLLQAIASGGCVSVLAWLALKAILRGQRLLQVACEETARRACAEDALRQAQKLEAIGQLTGGVAHDFNNLMMVVNTNLHIVKLKDQAGHFERELNAIDRAITNGQSLTRQLMAFSRRQPLQIETIDLAEHLPVICDLIKHSLRPGITLECQIAAHTWKVCVDVSELELALLNLAVNARDAMPEGGSIHIQVGNLNLDGSVSPTNPLFGEFVGILVRDTGHGVPADVLERVFEPFFTTKGVGQGTGLGLSQVHGFASESGGTAMMASRPADGTTVTLFLPRALASEPEHTGQTRRTIVVAEASVAVGESIAALLEELGYRTRVTRDSMEVLDILTRGLPCDLLLADVAMQGGMNGVDLVRVVRSRFPDLPVVLMSGFGTADPRGQEEGLTVLSKPFDMQTLTSALDAWFRENFIVR
jgi:two-component system NtrC family sensor kinase